MVYQLPARDGGTEARSRRRNRGSSARRVIPPTTSPRSRPDKGKAFWQGEVQKMIKVYKAPIGQDDAADHRQLPRGRPTERPT